MKKAIRLTCPECGAATKYGEKMTSSTHRGHTIKHKLPADWCTKCDEGIVGPDGMKIHKRVFSELQALVHGTCGPAEITRIRKRLRLSQRKAGDLFVGGIRAFQRYESGDLAISVPLSHLLKLLDRHPEQLRELQK
jgi:HTH-type transcriptional regulator / antitoxin MqsA